MRVQYSSTRNCHGYGQLENTYNNEQKTNDACFHKVNHNNNFRHIVIILVLLIPIANSIHYSKHTLLLHIIVIIMMHSASPSPSPPCFRGTPPSASYYGCSQLRRSVKRSYGGPPAFLGGALSREESPSSLSIVVLDDDDDNDLEYHSGCHPSQVPSIGGGSDSSESSKDDAHFETSSSAVSFGDTENCNMMMMQQDSPNHHYKRIRLSDHSSRSSSLLAESVQTEPKSFQGMPLQRGRFVFQGNNSSY